MIKQKTHQTLAYLIFTIYLCTAKAQMAESVDALVSNTSGATHPGSIPGLGTLKVDNRKIVNLFFLCVCEIL